MTPRTLFNIILKIFGLLCLKEIILTLPQLFYSFIYFTKNDTFEQGLNTFLVTSVFVLIYSIITYHLLFKTNNILSKLKLDHGFNEEIAFEHEVQKEEFSFTVNTFLVLNIAIIVIAGVILVNEIPNFLRYIYLYFQDKRTEGRPDYSFIIISFIKIIIALLLFGERKRIIEFVEMRQVRKDAEED